METNYRNSLEEDRIFRVYNDNTYKSLNNLNLLKSDLIGSNEVSNDNYNTNKEIDIKENAIDEKQKIKNELKDKALASLGGSMVYVEKDKLFWDGSEIEDEIEKK